MIWMELHCDGDSVKEYCENYLQNYPMTASKNTRFDSTATIRYLEKEATERGWRRKNGKWFCAGCRKKRGI